MVTVNNAKTLMRNGLGTPLVMLLLLAMMVLPLPPLMLDILFTFNISLAMLVMLVVVYASRPLEFSLFPTVLLIATLLRLGLNVASTRVVLLNGHTGTNAAGEVIESFAHVVVGGNFAVGVIVFLILVIINFVVVTKGAGRISEVSARFTLDALPGKQMAIDADLNSGAIGQEEAKARRQDIAREADFYGSMDGASKFVKGDAIAGILILVINILGGMGIGMLQYNLSFMEALHRYWLLAIGDALVAQVPSLILSTSAAIMVTRVADEAKRGMGEQVVSQLLGNPKIFMVTALILALMGIVPGMPHVAFLSIAAVIGLIAYTLHRREKINKNNLVVGPDGTTTLVGGENASEGTDLAPVDLSWNDVVSIDPIGLEVGYRLIPMVDNEQDGQLMQRIRGVRRKLSQELGFLIPPVHIRDNLELPPNMYRVTLMGVTVGETEIHPNEVMAINPGEVYGQLKGVPGKDPAFNLDAVWVAPDQKEHAQALGYTVVDSSTVVATHISQIIRDNAADLLGYEEVQSLLDQLALEAPKLVEALVPDVLPLNVIANVLQNLLREHVPIRDVRRICQTLLDYGEKTKEPEVLTEMARANLRGMIVQEIIGNMLELPVLTLDPNIEQVIQQTLSSSQNVGLEPGLAQRLQNALREMVSQHEITGDPAILLVSAPIRAFLARFTRLSVPGLHVLSFQEVPDNKQIRMVGVVTTEDLQEAGQQ